MGDESMQMLLGITIIYSKQVKIIFLSTVWFALSIEHIKEIGWQTRKITVNVISKKNVNLI